MLRKIFLFCSSFFIFALNSCGQDKKYKDYTEFSRHIFEGKELKTPYRLLVPKNFDTLNFQKEKQKYPLVIFLHGSGERGETNLVPLTHFAPYVLEEEIRTKYPCFVMIAQCPKDKKWIETDWKLASHTQPKEISSVLDNVLKISELIEKKYPIDTQKIYITGLSMGGFGVWDLIARVPEKFAAAVPVCGGGDEKTAKKMKNLPIWVFHGALDKAVKPERSRNMVKAIEKINGNIKYTEYPDVQHDSWKPAYSDKKMWEWLFKQKKGN
ncbi:MAG: phospholipase [Bacteroidetes bacterium]|nr:MAG: phospholipase [Bacteroidota bacterium]TAG90080.1 MAG: phospholipase [Bacteroidota bacterium]